MRLSFGFAITLLATLLVNVSTVATSAAETRDLEQTRDNLQSVREQIESTSSELAHKQQISRGLLQQLRKVDSRLKAAKQRVAQADDKLDEIKKQQSQEEAELEKGRNQIAQIDRRVRQRLIALYKSGDTQVVKLIFSSVSPSELLENYQFLQTMVTQDKDLLSAYRSLVEVNQKRLAHLEQLRREAETLLQQRQQEQQVLLQARRDKNSLLRKVRADETVLAQVLAELEEKAARLSDLVNRLESSSTSTTTASPFLAQKGKLDWPIKGEIRTGFGKGVDPELGTRYDSHGIEIAFSKKQHIRSVWDGEVVFANQFRGYGNLMILDHGGGYYSLYAQAAKLKKQVGDKVHKGDVIAEPGFEGTDVVYFEIRQGGTPVDPAAWLSRR